MKIMILKDKIIRFLNYQQEITKLNIHKENIRTLYQYYSDTNKEIGISQNIDSEDITITLTSYGDRINTVHLVIESLLMQTLKPREIILWLSKNEFCNRTLPLQLLKKQDRGLRIEYCDDLKSYKKLIPYLQTDHAKNIVTVDDDIIYPRDLIENLWGEHLCHPEDVIFTRGHVIQLLSTNRFAPYEKWGSDCDMRCASLFNIPTGVGGVLYPEGAFNAEVLDIETFTKLAPSADDLWFKAMTLLNHRASRQTSFGKNIIKSNDFLQQFVPIEDIQKDKLGALNVSLHKNDQQWQKLNSHFNLIDIFLESIK